MNYTEQLAFANAHNQFMIHSHIEATALSDSASTVRVEMHQDGLNAMGGIHGGLLFLMGDCAAGLLARATGSTFVTLDSNFRYLRDGREAKALVAHASLIKRGRTVTIVRSQVLTEEDQKVLAEGEFTFFCVDK